MAKKDPSKMREDEFDDDFGLSDLDNWDSDFGDFNMDGDDFDSEKTREPATKYEAMKIDLGNMVEGGLAGSVTGIASKVSKELPSVKDFGGAALSTASQLQMMKDSVMKDLAPTITQSKVVTRQLLQRVDGVVPEKIYKKLLDKLSTKEEDKSSTPSIEDARQSSTEESLNNIFKVQMEERATERKYAAAQKYLDQKVTATQHSESMNAMGVIANQAVFATQFMRSTFTAYMKKDLELQYRRTYLLEDTVGAITASTEILERGLDAIRHNTSLPDAQKIHKTEIIFRNLAESGMGRISDVASGYMERMFAKVKENYIDPAKELVGGVGDGLEGMLTMLEMEDEMGGSGGPRKTVMNKLGGFMGGALGHIGGRKLMDSIPAETKKVISDHAKLGKGGMILLLEQLRRGEIEFKGSDQLASVLENILPELDRSAGNMKDDVFNDPKAPGVISKKFTTTVEEIIPGYLAKQVALLQQMITGQEHEEQVYDFKKRDFVGMSDMKRDVQLAMYGDENERAAILKGNVDHVKEYAAFASKDKVASVDEISKELSIFMMNLALARRSIYIDMDGLREVAQGELDTAFAKEAFRGIKNPEQVAQTILGLLTKEDGSIDHAMKSHMEVRVNQLANDTSGKHAQAAYDAIFKFGQGRALKGLIDKDAQGNWQVNNDTYKSAYDDVSADLMKSGDFSDVDSLTGQKKKDPHGLEQAGRWFKDAKLVSGAARGAVKGADMLARFVAKKTGKEKEYEEFSGWVLKGWNDFIIWYQEKKLKFLEFTDEMKLSFGKMAKKALMASKKLEPLATLLFDDEGLYIADIQTPDNWLTFLVEIPGLHWALYKLFGPSTDEDGNATSKDTPLRYVLRSILPKSWVLMATLSKEEIDNIKETRPKTNIDAEIAAKKAAKQAKRDELRNEIEARKAGADIDREIDNADTPKSPTEPPVSEGVVGTQGNVDELTKIANKAVKPKKDTTTKQTKSPKKKADGDILDSDGNVSGILNKPTLLAEGKRDRPSQWNIAGEHGPEAVIPLNGNLRSQQLLKSIIPAVLGNGQPLSFKQVQQQEAMEKKGFLSKAGSFIDETTDSLIERLNREVENASSESLKKAAITAADLLASMDASKAVDKIESTTADAKKKAKKFYDDLGATYKKLKDYDYKASFNESVAAFHKFYNASKDEGLLQQLKPADRNLVWHIHNSWSKNDYGLEEVDPETRTTKQATPALKQIIQWYKKAYSLGSAAVQKAKDIGSKIVNSSIVQSGIKLGGVIKDKAGDVFDSAKEGLGNIASGISTAMKGFFQNKQGTLVDIAAKQLDVMYSILEELYYMGPETITDKVKYRTLKAKDKLREKMNLAKDKTKGIWSKTKSAAKFGLWTAPKETVKSAVGNVKDTVVHSLSNQIKAVYRKPGAGQVFDPSQPLISKADMEAGVYFDPEGKEKVKSFMDINKPVFDANGQPLITQDDLDQGLVDHNNKPLRSFGGVLGRAGRSAVGATADAVMSLKPVKTAVAIMSAPIDVAKSFIVKFVDIARADTPNKPLVTAQQQKDGRVVFATGKPVKSSYGIKSPVMWIDDPINGEKAGQVAINDDDIEAGLIDMKSGKPLDRIGQILGSTSRKVTDWVTGKAMQVLGGGFDFAVLAKNAVIGAAKYLVKGKNPYVDVYKRFKNGNVRKRPTLTGQGIKDGDYRFIDGEVVTSAYGIDRPVIDEDGNQLITEQDIENGLMDNKGNKLTKIAGSSLLKKAGAGIVGLAGKGLALGWKGVKGAGKIIGNIVKGTKTAMETGSDALSSMFNAIGGAFKSLTGSDKIMKQDLIEIVGERLVNIHELLQERLPMPKKKIKGDTDGDGDRDGGYKDQVQKSKERKQRAKEKLDASKKNKKGKAGAAGAAGSADSEEGGFMEDMASTAAGQWLGDKAGGLLSKGKGLLGRAGGAILRGGGGLLKGGLGLLGKGAGLVAGKIGLAGAGTALMGTASTALAGTGSAIAGAVGSVAALASNPVGWAIGAGLLAYSGYKLATWMFSDSEEATNFLKLRYEAYGVTEDQEDLIEDLEELTLEIMLGERSEMTDQEFEEFAEDCGLIDGSFLGMGGDDRDTIKKKVSFFASWYAMRFRPLFEQYANMYVRVTGDPMPDELDFDDLEDGQKTHIVDTFKQYMGRILGIAGVKDLAPTLEAFTASLKAKETTTEKDKSKEATKTGASLLAQNEAAKVKEKEEKLKKGDPLRDAQKSANNELNAETTKRKQDLVNAANGPGIPTSAAAAAAISTQNGGAPGTGTGTPSAADVMNMTISPVDIGDGGGDLGEYVKEFESGKRGSEAIGYDRTGGTSYGTYQFAARTGSFKEFLTWLKGKKDAAVTSFADLMLSKSLDTGSKKGEAPDIWRTFAAKNKEALGSIEHEYMFSKYYKVALAKIQNPKAKQLLTSDRGLQEALWSTAIQHGQGGAGSIFNKSYREGMTAKEWLTAIYQSRGTKFGSSSAGVQQSVRNRFAKELNVVASLSDSAPPVGATGANQSTATNEGSKEPTNPEEALASKDVSAIKKAIMELEVKIADPERPAFEKVALSQKLTALKNELKALENPKVTKSSDIKDSKKSSQPSIPSVVQIPSSSSESATAQSSYSSNTHIAPSNNDGGTSEFSSNTTDGTQEVAHSVDLQDLDAAEGFDKLKPQSGVSLNYGGYMKSAIGKLNSAYMKEFKGEQLVVTSGHRSMEKQAQLYKKYGPGRAAKPNAKAPHIAGFAIDIDGKQLSKADKAGLLEPLGLHRPFWPRGVGRTPAEEWHLELIGARDGKVDPNAPEPEAPGGKEPTEKELANKPDVVTPEGMNGSAATLMNAASASLPPSDDSALGKNQDPKATAKEGGSLLAEESSRTNTAHASTLNIPETAPLSTPATTPVADTGAEQLTELKTIALLLAEIKESLAPASDKKNSTKSNEPITVKELSAELNTTLENAFSESSPLIAAIKAINVGSSDPVNTERRVPRSSRNTNYGSFNVAKAI